MGCISMWGGGQALVCATKTAPKLGALSAKYPHATELERAPRAVWRKSMALYG